MVGDEKSKLTALGIIFAQGPNACPLDFRFLKFTPLIQIKSTVPAYCLLFLEQLI